VGIHGLQHNETVLVIMPNNAPGTGPQFVEAWEAGERLGAAGLMKIADSTPHGILSVRGQFGALALESAGLSHLRRHETFLLSSLFLF
jgi:hypothetical protein